MNLKLSIALAELYCARGEKCVFDVKTYLIRKKISKEIIDDVITHLLKNDFINEERFVNAFVHDKVVLAKWGPIKVKASLLMKGINQKLIDEILLTFKVQSSDFEEIAMRKWPTIKGDTFNNKKQKLIRFLLQKGYQPDLVFKWIEKKNFNI